MMDQKTLWQAYRSLPDEAQRQLADFIAFLRAKYRVVAPIAPTATGLEQDPFIGMWQDRTDMNDSTTWVRHMRKQEWHDHSA